MCLKLRDNIRREVGREREREIMRESVCVVERVILLWTLVFLHSLRLA